jgi:hypothetical protein
MFPDQSAIYSTPAQPTSKPPSVGDFLLLKDKIVFKVRSVGQKRV